MITDLIKKNLSSAFTESKIVLDPKIEGKVRDSYTLGNQQRLIITTDRLSAFDQVLKSIPFKGQVLNQLSAWWFGQTKEIIKNHLINLPDPNAAVVQEVTPFPVEVIVRGYISGVTKTALWYRYSMGERHIYGYDFPDGLHKNQQLPEPIITPTTKGGPTGRDERLTCAEVTEKGYLEKKTWDIIQDASIRIFKKGQELASKAGLILVDTKYEFGLSADGEIILIDEVHTPDSSRFWKADTYQARIQQGLEPENFDKEFIRILYAEHDYRGEGEVPQLPADTWTQASKLYIDAFEMLTGQKFVPGDYPVNPRLVKNLRKAGILK